MKLKGSLAPFCGILLSILLTALMPHYALAQNWQTRQKIEKREPKWATKLDVSQWYPASWEKNYPTSEVETLVWYHFNSDWASTFYLYAGKNWLRKKEIDEEEAESFVDDVRISLVWKGEYSTRFALFLPTSDESKEMNRKFAVSAQPSTTFKFSDGKLALRAEFSYYNNGSDTYYSKSESAEVTNNIYGLTPKFEFGWDFSRRWSFGAKGNVSIKWDKDGFPVQDYELTFGPTYSFNKTTSLALLHFSADEIYSDNKFLSHKVSYYGLALSFNL